MLGSRSVLRSPALTPSPGSNCEVCLGWSGERICSPCRDRFAAPKPRCTRCGLPLAAGIAVCGDCRRNEPPFAGCVCAVDYVFPWDRLIARFKYHQQPELALPLATLLAQAARAAGADRPQSFVPVPLSAPRLAERGYDQAWELARRLGRLCGLSAQPRLLKRRFDGAHQAGLGQRERLTNLRGAFAAAPRARIHGQHLALVDDVMTTGATAHEAASALLAAGAARVDLWIVARTPAPAG